MNEPAPPPLPSPFKPELDALRAELHAACLSMGTSAETIRALTDRLQKAETELAALRAPAVAAVDDLDLFNL
jgi:hypothetical protein